MKILVVTAHPDDLEISCAGTLKRFQEQGAEIISVITVAPSAEVNVKRNKDIVVNELKNSYALSQFKYKIFDTPLHANGRPNLVADNVTMTALSRLVESCDIAIIPHPEDFHQDHENTHALVWPLVRKLASEVWLMHTVPYCFDHRSNSANLFFNIADRWEFKQQLLECYSSYFNSDDINKIYTANQYWGQQNNSELAEAFTIIKKYVE
jgi:N-acetylglucosamine malate deacetylase 1